MKENFKQWLYTIEYNKIPFTAWYLRCKLNLPKKWGYESSLEEYAQFKTLYFYVGEIYLNDWRHDA